MLRIFSFVDYIQVAAVLISADLHIMLQRFLDPEFDAMVFESTVHCTYNGFFQTHSRTKGLEILSIRDSTI